jgi:DNA-directed RNA polymerase specialized sigma24 family protein
LGGCTFEISDSLKIILMKNSGAKMKEIAEILQMPRGTVSWRYSEALKILKKYLEVQE